MSVKDENFICFKEDTSQIALPPKFTFPFDYSPHPLAIKASQQLQTYLESQNDWIHDFGIANPDNPEVMGKMFGVLVVKDPNNQLGYLQAFSGIMGKKTELNYFVPPIFNRLKPGFNYTQKEKEIIEINKEIAQLTYSKDFLDLKEQISLLESEIGVKLKEQKRNLKQEKKQRQAERKRAKLELSPKDYDHLHLKHQKQSRLADFNYKSALGNFEEKKAEIQVKLTPLENRIIELKTLRKQMSADAQQLIFNQYNFLNAEKKSVGVQEIFKNTSTPNPPSGAGDCAAPKLLQFAFENNYQPIALAEFWWGKSPKLEVRQHKKFYPACRSKCHPILTHMLKGLDVDENPVMNYDPKELIIMDLYEDEHILVINKPAHLLSVPGKKLKDSVQSRMEKRFPELTCPLIVHRLDMGTSGIMVLSKNMESYHKLQKQFTERLVSKMYVAILDGIPQKKSSFIDLPLRVDLNNRPNQVVCYEHGKHAETKWKLIASKNGRTMVHFYPKTGRTHQLRVHASHPQGLNTPILGDELYGLRKDRMYLHAQELVITHPFTQKQMKFSCPNKFNF